MSTERMISATYRLQVHGEFGFARVREIADYLHRLGISHVYSSPILRARPGSTHGYDVADPTVANPELGGEAERVAMVDALRERDLGLILDIVPNHMGTGPANPYWQDVLTHGRASEYAKWFDVEWEAPSRTAPGRLLLPVLGDERESALQRGELGVAWENGALFVTYFDNRFPTDPATVPVVVRAGEGVAGVSDEDRAALRAALDALGALPPRDEAAASLERGARKRAGDAALGRLRALADRSAGIREHLEQSARDFGDGREAIDRLRAFLDAQPYRLRFWRLAPRDLNYRRFFDINELVALRMEDPEVFAETHATILGWVADRSLDGLRIDHIDGLLDPHRYLAMLRSAVRDRGRGDDARPFPIWVEKILSPGEHLREEWPVHGTTGYEFLNDLEAIFIEPIGHAAITRFYAGLTGLPDFAELAHRGKVFVLEGSLASDLGRLARLLAPLADAARRTRGLGRAELRRALIELIAAQPVYRTYVDPRTGALSPADRAVIERTARAAVESGTVALEAVELVRRAMLHADHAMPEAGELDVTDDVDVPADGVSDGEVPPPDLREQALAFVARFQQTSGPATAKGVEDTALYQHYPLASLNEVGGEPDRPLERAVSILHEANAERARRWPGALLCTNTHDTKRSADVRARLDVLSEMPDRWEASVLRWRRMNRTLRTRVRDRMAPDANTEYLLYQTLVGVWPVPGSGRVDAAALESLRERVSAYMLKAVREGKRHTSWTDPDEAFENALGSFIERIFEAGPESDFLRDLAGLVAEVARPGMWNALSRALVHLTSPGTPDIYQGDELWNFSLVDPDNRRPVDYAERARLLKGLADARSGNATPVELLRDLMATPEDGRIKLYVMWQALQCRCERVKFFQGAGYEALEVRGKREGNVFAFARPVEQEAAVVVVQRLPYGTTGANAAPVGHEVWGDTRLRLPARASARRWRCQLSSGVVESAVEADGGWVPVGAVFQSLPVALLFPE